MKPRAVCIGQCVSARAKRGLARRSFAFGIGDFSGGRLGYDNARFHHIQVRL